MIESPVLDEVKEILLKRGRAEGRAEALQTAVATFLEARFGLVPADLKSKLTAIGDLPRLESLVRLAATCPDLEVFIETLKTDKR